MKKIIVYILICVTAAAGFFAFSACGMFAADIEPIRIHIRANSNSEVDQAVKLLVRGEVIDYLTPKLENAANREEAYNIISASVGSVKSTAKKTLTDKGFGYGASVKFTREYFPARSYGSTVYDAGEYDALIIELGAGVGDNWWCVAYPPLCFYGNENPEYTSLILELFK